MMSEIRTRASRVKRMTGVIESEPLHNLRIIAREARELSKAILGTDGCGCPEVRVVGGRAVCVSCGSSRTLDLGGHVREMGASVRRFGRERQERELLGLRG